MCYNFYLFLIPRAMYFMFNKSHMFVRLNLVANLMYVIYVNNTLPLALAVHEITDIFGPPMVETTKRGHFIQKSVRCCRHDTSWAPCS